MGPMRTARWESDLAHIARWCAESPGSIVAGDFNATADNAAFRAVLRRCRSAADGTGKGLVGTFPAGVPSWCGIQIDHVLVPDRMRGLPVSRCSRSRAATTARCWPGSACRRAEEGPVA